MTTNGGDTCDATLVTTNGVDTCDATLETTMVLILVMTIEAVNAGLVSLCKEKAATFADNTPSFTLSDGSVNDGYLLPDGVHLTRTAVDRVVKNLRLPVKGPTRGVTASQQKPRQSQTARAERRPPRAQEVEDEGWQKVRRRSHRTSTPPRGNTQCYFCGESGHVKDSCRHGHRVECNTCGGLGHKAKFCTR